MRDSWSTVFGILVLLLGGFLVKSLIDLRAETVEVNAQLRMFKLNQAASLQEGARRSAAPNQQTIPSRADSSLESIQRDIRHLAREVAQLKARLPVLTTAREPEYRPPGGADALPMPNQSTSAAAHLGPDPGALLKAMNSASPEQRDMINDVMREHAERARERLAKATSSSESPDPALLSQIMAEAQEDIIHELEGILPTTEFVDLFPPKRAQ